MPEKNILCIVEMTPIIMSYKLKKNIFETLDTDNIPFRMENYSLSLVLPHKRNIIILDDGKYNFHYKCNLITYDDYFHWIIENSKKKNNYGGFYI